VEGRWEHQERTPWVYTPDQYLTGFTRRSTHLQSTAVLGCSRGVSYRHGSFISDRGLCTGNAGNSSHSRPEMPPSWPLSFLREAASTATERKTLQGSRSKTFTTSCGYGPVS
jgi:hypothetical protein